MEYPNIDRPFVIFENDGEIDIRAVKSFGVSAKETKSPIGYFGTGLKYAISILVRTGHEVRILAGDKAYTFGIKRDTMRGKEFEFLTMNGEELPYTTELGKNWGVPQAFREIYCNTIDENGSIKMGIRPGSPTKGVTRIEVRGSEFEKCYYNRDEIVLRLPDSLLVADDDVKIYKKPSVNLYYRGIAVGMLPAPSDFTYNIIREMTLTEDRSIKYSFIADRHIGESVTRIKDSSAARRILTARENTFEAGIDFRNVTSSVHQASPEFVATLEEEFANGNQRLNRTAKDWLRYLKPKEAMEDEHKEIELNSIYKAMLVRAVEALAQRYPDISKVPIVAVKSLGTDYHGLADLEKVRIIISLDAFQQGTKYVASTVLEEFIHLKTGYSDLTRKLQTYLFDEIVSMIEETILKKPI